MEGKFAAKRESQIQQNQALLLSLGLAPILPTPKPKSRPPITTPVQSKKRKAPLDSTTPTSTPKAQKLQSSPESGGSRRSSRIIAALSSPAPSHSPTFASLRDDYEDDRVAEGAAPKSLNKNVQRPNPKKFGHIEGSPVGTSWQFRMACSQAGVHGPPVGGIAGNEHVGAWSVVLSGGYADDIDLGYSFTYTGSGGRDLKTKNLRTGPQTFDQTWTGPNAALKKSVDTQKPVRVVRGFKNKGCWAPDEAVGYRYDGLYKIARAWLDVGESGFKVCRYAFVRLDGQPEIPIKEGREQEAKKLLKGYEMVVQKGGK